MTSIQLNDVFDRDLLMRMLEGRFVKCTRHPSAALRILNYTARAQYEREWNPVTLQCRGLIVDDDDVVVARPFAKFFNLDEHDVSGLGGEVHVTEKLDGSLGVLFPIGGSWQIATRGSFESEQALEATRMWHEEHTAFRPNPQWTYLFEIIYPQNRIVVDYGERRELVLLGAVENATGRSVALDDAATGWTGPVVSTLPYRNVRDALAAEAVANAEGMVLHFVEHDVRVKLKHEEYVRLHRLVTGVSERRVWEVLSAGGELDSWLESVPDELYRFVTLTRERMLTEFSRQREALSGLYIDVINALPDGFSRREFAERVLELKARNPLAALLFAVHDAKPVDAALWETLRPAEHLPFFSRGDDE